MHCRHHHPPHLPGVHNGSNMCGHGGHHTCFLCSAQGQGLFLKFNLKVVATVLITRSEYSTMSAWKSTTKTCCSSTQTTDLSQLGILAGSCPILYIRKLITNMITVALATMMTKTPGIHASIRYPFKYQVSMQVSGIHANIRYPCKPSENKDKGVKCLEWKQQVAELLL